MTSSESRKGDRAERDLVNELHERGYAVIRAPASGAATDRELPDVLAGDGVDHYAIEVKVSGGNPIYLSKDEVDDLGYFAKNFGATPLIGAKFDMKDGDHAYGVDGDIGIRFFYLDEIVTENGAHRVKREKWEDSGFSVSVLVGDNTPIADLHGKQLKRRAEPMQSATDDEREQIFTEYEFAIFPSSVGMSGEKSIHLPQRPDTDDRTDTDALCDHSTQRNVNLRRKPIDTYPNDSLTICDYCIEVWRGDGD